MYVCTVHAVQLIEAIILQCVLWRKYTGSVLYSVQTKYMHALQPPEYHDNREVMVPITSLSSRSSDLIVAKQMFSC